MSQHTPGPWEYDTETETIRVKQWMDNPLMGDCRGCIIADFEQSHGGKYRRDSVRGLKGTIEANARLIATAPELLDACKEALVQIEYLHDKFKPTGTGEAVLTRLRAIIAKTTGLSDTA